MKFYYTNWVLVPNAASALRLRIPRFLSRAYSGYCIEHQSLMPPIWFRWILKLFGMRKEYADPTLLPPGTTVLTKHDFAQRRDNDNALDSRPINKSAS